MSTEVAVQQEVNVTKGFQVIEVGAMGPVAMYNTDMVTPKTLGIIQAILEKGGFDDIGHGIFSIVFRDDGRPVAETGFNSWKFFPAGKSVVCNLQDCVEMAIHTTQDKKKELTECISVKMLAWKNLLQGFAHDAHHAYMFLQEDGLWDDAKVRADEEKVADDFARALMFQLAKAGIDLEPDLGATLNEFVDVFLTEELESVESNKKAPKYMKRWAELQRKMMASGAVYYDPADPKKANDIDFELKTMKEFLHWCSGDAEDDPDWATPTIATQLELIQEPHGEAAGGAPAVTTVVDADYDDDDYIDDDDGFDAAVEAAPAGFQGVAAVQTPAAQPVYQQPAQPVYQAPVAQQPVYQQPAPQYQTPAANPEVQVGANMYAPVELPATVDAKTVIYGLYLKIWQHVFQGCQYNPTLTNGAFNLPQNIAALVPLNQYELMFVKEMIVDTPQGGIQQQKVEGAIVGKMMDKAKTLPGYELTLQTPDGQQIKRRFIPQNPNKVVNGALTRTAQEAKNGAQIMWIIDPDIKGFNVRVKDGVVQKSENGQWVNA